MRTTVTPITDLGTRLQEGGRIRIGDRGGKNGAPRTLETFRFTSPQREPIEQLAVLYGGKVSSWEERAAKIKSQWQVTTEADHINVWLRPNGITQFYELWSSSVCDRRCDGEMVEIPRPTEDGQEYITQPCICDAKNEMACKPKTRLTVILPEIQFVGGWRLETSSWDAARSMPSMAEMISMVQDEGLCRGILTLKEGSRKIKTKKGPQTRRYRYPELVINASPIELMSGDHSVAGLPTASRDTAPAELVEAPPERVLSVPEIEEVFDAEIVESWSTKGEAIKAGVANDDLVRRDDKRWYLKT